MLRHVLPLLLLAGAVAGGESLIPLRNLQVTDGLGMRWDMRPDGSVNDGTRDAFDGGQLLQVNGQQFQCNQPMATADGSEMVFTGTCAGIEVTRRVAVMQKEGACRWLEVLRNPGSTQVTATLTVNSNLGSSAGPSLWSDGKPAAMGGAVPKNVVGLLAPTNPGNSRPSILWVVGENRAVAPPSITTPDNENFSISWQVKVPAGRTLVIAHWCLQRQNLNVADLPNLLKPIHHRGRLVRFKHDAKLLAAIANFRRGDGSVDDAPADGPSLTTIDGLLSEYEIERGTAEDQLLAEAGSTARMVGTVDGGPLALRTPYGEVPLPVEELAAIRGGPLGALFYTRTGEALLAATVGGTVRIAAGGDVVLPFDPLRIVALVTRRKTGDGAAPKETLGFVATADGQRLALAGLTTPVELATFWGTQRLTLAEIDHVVRVSEPRPSWLVVLTDGSRLHCLPAQADLALASRRCGAVTLPCPTLTGFTRVGAPAFSDDPPGELPERLSRPTARLRDGTLLAGVIEGETLAISGSVGVDGAASVRCADLREISVADEGGMTFRLSDTSTIVGRPSDGTLVLVAGSRRWSVRAAELAAWRAADPPPPPPAKDDEPAKDEDSVKDGEPAKDGPSAPASATGPEKAVPAKPAAGKAK